MKAWTGFQPGRETLICMRCPAMVASGVPPQANDPEIAGAICFSP